MGSSERSRFIDQQQFGILDERAADPDALTLSAGKLVSALVGHVIETDALEQPEGFIDVGLRKAAQPALPESDIAEPAGENVFHHRQPLDQRIFLEDHAHPAASAPQFAAAELHDVDAVEFDRSRGRLDQPVDAADHRRFARAGRADQRHHLPIGHIDVDALEREIARAIALGQTFDAQHRCPRDGIVICRRI